jgi:hypothetical protein
MFRFVTPTVVVVEEVFRRGGRESSEGFTSIASASLASDSSVMLPSPCRIR